MTVYGIRVMKPVIEGYDVTLDEIREKKNYFVPRELDILYQWLLECLICCRTIQRDAMQEQRNVHRLWHDNVKFISNNYGCYYVHR